MTTEPPFSVAPAPVREPYPVQPSVGVSSYGAQQPAATTNPLAIVAFCAALGGLVFGIMASVVGIVLGFMALAEVKRTGQNGRGLAGWAIGLGFGIGVGSILFVLLMFLWVFGVFAAVLWTIPMTNV